MSMRMRFEFKLQDLWVGVYWRRSVDEAVEVNEGRAEAVMVTAKR